MSDIKREREIDKKRIFYCNITYGCNSDCIFCYSHNTKHSGVTHKEIDVKSFVSYLEKNNINKNDRVIVNGGEPLLHSKIGELLKKLKSIGCEVLIYTNGRLLSILEVDMISEKFRFVVPIHGFEELHDEITGVVGSYFETVNGLHYLASHKSKPMIDVKIIINMEMINDEKVFKKTLESLENVPLNNSVHITKMADTIVSKRNNCESIDEDTAAVYTKMIYEYYAYDYKVKIFDTCIKKMRQYIPQKIKYKCLPEVVYFKDLNQESIVELEKPALDCASSCELAEVCQSAVGEYKVLEFYKNDVYIELE